MKKLKLDAESLRVEPFEVMPHDAEKGTVVAAGATTICQPSAGGSCDTGIPICVYCRAF